MRIGIAGPISPEEIANTLGVSCGGLPEGMGGTAVTSLVAALARAGHDVVVYSLSLDVVEDITLQVGPVRMHFGAYRARARSRAGDFFRSEREAIARFIQRDPADVVNAHWSYEFALGALSECPETVVTVRDWSPLILRMRPDAYRFVRLLMDRRCLRVARHMSCASPYMQERLAGYGKDPSLTPNMVSPAAAVGPVRSSLAGRRIICVANGYGGRKNVAVLLRALVSLPDCELTLVGNGLGPGEEAHREAAALGLADRVHFMGQLDHRATINAMRDADVMVHPALEESFGNVLVESMAQGIPVIGGASAGAVPWVLDHGQAGVLVDVRDPSAIGAAVARLLDDHDEWRRLSVAGRKRVEECFSESAVVESYLAVYRKVLGE